jgi:hypothetical protein
MKPFIVEKFKKKSELWDIPSDEILKIRDVNNRTPGRLESSQSISKNI